MSGCLVLIILCSASKSCLFCMYRLFWCWQGRREETSGYCLFYLTSSICSQLQNGSLGQGWQTWAVQFGVRRTSCVQSWMQSFQRSTTTPSKIYWQIPSLPIPVLLNGIHCFLWCTIMARDRDGNYKRHIPSITWTEFRSWSKRFLFHCNISPSGSYGRRKSQESNTHTCLSRSAFHEWKETTGGRPACSFHRPFKTAETLSPPPASSARSFFILSKYLHATHAQPKPIQRTYARVEMCSYASFLQAQTLCVLHNAGNGYMPTHVIF